MKKNCLKLLFFVATLFMMGQETAAQIVDRWEIPGLKDSGMDAEYTGYFYIRFAIPKAFASRNIVIFQKFCIYIHRMRI